MIPTQLRFGPLLVQFDVPALPETNPRKMKAWQGPIGQGQITSMPIRKDGKVTGRRSFHSNSRELKPWRERVADHAKQAIHQMCDYSESEGLPLPPLPYAHAVILGCQFVVARKRGPKQAALVQPTDSPDTSHYVRAIEDALTGVLWLDDAQVIGYGPMFKRFTEDPQVDPPGVIVQVWESHGYQLGG